MIGIYKITSPSNKIYIGQSINIKKRFKKYKRLDCKSQPRLYKSFLKYGFINHLFEIIEECKFEELNIRERYWQDYYDVINEKGLNCVLTETDLLPKLTSTITKNNMLNSLPKGINHHNSKKVFNVITLETYDSLSECCVKNNLNPKYMSRVLSGNRINKTDFLYKNDDNIYFSKLKYKPIKKEKIIISDYDKYINRRNAKLGIKNGMYGKTGINNSVSKKVIDVISGKIYDSLNNCCKINNLSAKNMSRKLNGTRTNNTTYKYL